MVPNLTESASIGTDGKLHITLTNLSVDKDYELDTVITDAAVKAVSGTILTNNFKAFNTFDEPEKVVPAEFTGAQITDSGLKFTIPACSVLHLEVEI